MYCNNCKGKLRCTETRSATKERVTYRRYRCSECGELTFTVERPTTDADEKRQIYIINKLEQALRKVGK